MSTEPTVVPGLSGAPPNQMTVTLDPLRIEGPDAIATNPEDHILLVKARKIVLAWENVTRHTVTTAADDLFQPAVPEIPPPETIPKGAKLLHATLAFFLPDAPEPGHVDLHPPAAVKLQRPADAPRILPFLSRHGFAAARKLAASLVILLALVNATVPDLTDDDDDDDDANDDVTEHCHFPA